MILMLPASLCTLHRHLAHETFLPLPQLTRFPRGNATDVSHKLASKSRHGALVQLVSCLQALSTAMMSGITGWQPSGYCYRQTVSAADAAYQHSVYCCQSIAQTGNSLQSTLLALDVAFAVNVTRERHRAGSYPEQKILTWVETMAQPDSD